MNCIFFISSAAFFIIYQFSLMATIMKAIPNLGIGIGLRPPHYEDIFRDSPAIDWFEIISENYMVDGGAPIENLKRILDCYPVVQHGVSLAIGSPTPLDFDYLKKLKKLTRLTGTPWVSDHLCWGQVPHGHFHDLLPLPYTKEVIDYVAERARIVQDFLELPFALENLSSYVTFVADEMPEWEFYGSVVEKADIFMMLDVNNIYVSSRNHGFDPMDYIKNLPLDRVIQIHLAGHRDYGDHVIDTHDDHVKDEVWDLYAQVYPQTKGVSTLLEWDDHLISFEETWKEACKAKQFQGQIYHSHPQTLNFDSARQSQIEALRSERRSPSPSGKGEEEDQFGKVVASQNSKFEGDCGIQAVR